MIIGQITDLHLGFAGDKASEPNQLRLDAVLERLIAFRPHLDLLLVTGDLTERGDQASMTRLRDRLERLPFPWAVLPGNHDLRSSLLEVFPETPSFDGYVQSALETFALRILLLDTVEEGRHAGAFDGGRAAWLERVLAAAPGQPTLLVMHHPPVPIGIDWMSASQAEPWTHDLTAVVAKAPQVVGAIAGHVHRPIVTPWAGTLLRVCPAVAPQLALNLSPINPARPDGRALLVSEPPGFAVHHWTPAGGLTTHFATVGPAETLLRYNEGFQPVIQRFLKEREQLPSAG